MAGKSTVGIVGLGIMGGAMARNLLADGWRVLGYDVDAATVANARKDGIEIAASVAELALAASDIITSLPKPEAVIATTEAIAAAGSPRRVVLEASTLSLDDKQTFAAILEGAGHVALDCPLSGTGAQARENTGELDGHGWESAPSRVHTRNNQLTESHKRNYAVCRNMTIA